MSGKTLILVHGRDFKPAPDDLWPLWQQALAAGLSRDFESDGGSVLLAQARLEQVYYGDLCNEVLERSGRTEDAELDLADRQHALKRLVALDGAKRFRRLHYEALPGKTALKEFLVDIGAPLLASLRLTQPVLRRVMPDMAEYLERESEFRRVAQERLLAALLAAIARGDRVLLLAHCLGSVVAYDVLWRMSYDPGITPRVGGHRVHTWITLGSPLADEFVKSRLEGAQEPVERRYPKTLVDWYNIAAEDDYVCHDESMANDYGAMLRRRQISEIRDFRIYNLAVRYGRSSPHSAIGYLIHPRTVGLLASWLRDPTP
jgi:hypothetical protein